MVKNSVLPHRKQFTITNINLLPLLIELIAFYIEDDTTHM